MKKSQTGLDEISNAIFKFLVPLSMQETYKNIVKEAVSIAGADHGSITLREKGQFKRYYSTSPELYKIKNRPRANAYKVYSENKPMIVDMMEALQAHPYIKNLKIKTLIMLPLSYQKRAIGVLSLAYSRKKSFSDDEMQKLRVFSSLASLAIKKNQLYNEEKRALELRNQFIAVIAHELRTPLTSISGYTQLLNKKQTDKDSTQAKWLQEVYAETLKLGNLINEVITVNQIESKKQTYSFADTKLNSVVDKAIKTLKQTYPKHEYIIVNKITAKKDSLIGDADKLYQMFVSLIDNASKFSVSNPKILITLSEEEKKLFVTIQDNGQGISREDLPFVFNLFYKGKENFVSGMGLGLVLAKEVVNKHKGKIKIESQEGVGTTVTIGFPKLVL